MGLRSDLIDRRQISESSLASIEGTIDETTDLLT